MPRLTFHPDGSAHQLDQTGTNGQAQPGPAEAPGGGSICLGKGAEQPSLLVRGQSDAGVLNLKAKFHLVAASGAQ